MRTVLALAIVGLLAAPAVAQEPSLAGTWTMNTARSKYSPRPAPKNESVTYVATTDGFAYSVTATEADGSPTKLTGALHFDGRDVAVARSPDYDTVASRRVDAYTTETTRKKAGKVVQTVTRVVSHDGRTLTLTTKGTNARGDTIGNVGVYDRQR